MSVQSKVIAALPAVLLTLLVLKIPQVQTFTRN